MAQFKELAQVGEDVAAAAKVAVEKSLKVQADEKVLIISNPDPEVTGIAMAVYDAVVAAKGRPTLMFQDVKTQLDCAEDAVIASFDSQPDVVISLSREKMGKDRDGMENPYDWDEVSYEHVFHYQLYGAKTVRAFWSPSVTREMFARTVPIDYADLKNRCVKIAAVLEKAVTVRVTNPGGTDIMLCVKGRKPHLDDGDYSRPGAGGNLPAGEVFVSPVVGSAEGVIVFDGSISSHSGDLVIKDKIACVVNAGYVTEIKGGAEADALLETISIAESKALEMGESGSLPKDKAATFAKNARNIGELGIGLNPKAEVRGNMLEDEKALGTCHFAIGSNYDDDAPALIHLDGLVSSPTIVATLENGKEIVIERDGVPQSLK